MRTMTEREMGVYCWYGIYGYIEFGLLIQARDKKGGVTFFDPR